MAPEPSQATVDKALALLTSRGVSIAYADDTMVTAKVSAAGRERPYEVTYVPVYGEWHCECAGFILGGYVCSHIIATAYVWHPPTLRTLRAVE